MNQRSKQGKKQEKETENQDLLLACLFHPGVCESDNIAQSQKKKQTKGCVRISGVNLCEQNPVKVANSWILTEN